MVERPHFKLVALALSLAVLGSGLASGNPSEGKKKPASAVVQEYAIVGGTVFRDSGFALAEAEVTLEVAADDPAGSKPKGKIKKLKAISSPRGEFSFRVPPVAAKYRVAVSAKGFQPAEKVVELTGGSERVDATFTLSPESKH